jgi:hypothetical protein
VVGLIQRQAEVRRAESPGQSWQRRVARSAPVTRFLDTAWPVVTPEQLVWSLLSDPAALGPAADGILDEAEQRLLGWARPPRSARGARWSPADLVLLDEAAGLLERMPSFGHVVVDEAQDLSPMQARALARRSSHGSLTVLGDLAQGTAAWAATEWRATLAHLGKPDAPVIPLTTGFRVPAAVLSLANRLLPALATGVPPAVSLRRDGTLAIMQVPDLAAAVVSQVASAMAVEGSIAVIAADADVGPLHAALAADLGENQVDMSEFGLNKSKIDDPGRAAARVTVLPASLAKGLEFDHVIAVEPAAIVAGEKRGLHRLYVVLTRAVSRLTVLHSRPLPPSLVGRPDPVGGG